MASGNRANSPQLEVLNEHDGIVEINDKILVFKSNLTCRTRHTLHRYESLLKISEPYHEFSAFYPIQSNV